MYTIYCDFCGFHEKSDFITNTYCKHCGHDLIIENDADDNNITDMINKGEGYIPKKENIDDSKCIENMKRSLEKLGHKEVWDILEDMPNAYHRIYYRNIFKKAGGKI